MRRRASVLAACLVVALGVSWASPRATADDTDVQKGLAAPPEDIAKWRQLKFGLFIHWGPVSLKGTEIGWSRGGPRRGHRPDSNPNGIPVEVYDNLYKEFNPVKFDAKEWVDIAKASGMKYLVFTTKHHDGFVNFDSKLTDYKITSPESPYRRDIVKQLADACHEGGLVWGIYYSPPDWHHPDYRAESHARYVEYLHGQLRELLTNYGEVGMIFFDGLGGTAADWDAPTLLPMCRKLQPHIIINNRAGLPADNDTPEQRIGKMQTDRPWETCMTLCTQWAWKPDDKMKSLQQCLHTLVRVVGGDGNLLFNVGPMPDGRIEPRQVERLKEMGQWLAKHGRTIYDTRGGPFAPDHWGAATCRQNTVFVHVLDPKLDRVVLPPINKRIVSSEVLTGGKAAIEQTDEAVTITIQKADRDPIDTIVALELDGPAAEAKVGSPYGEPISQGQKAAASNVHQGQVDEYGPQRAIDGSDETRWATDGGTHEAWLEVDLGKPTALRAARITEACDERVEKFEILAKADPQSPWKTIHRGTRIGEERLIPLDPITAQVIRLNILKANEGPTIWEFQLFGPSSKPKP